MGQVFIVQEVFLLERVYLKPYQDRKAKVCCQLPSTPIQFFKVNKNSLAFDKGGGKNVNTRLGVLW